MIFTEHVIIVETCATHFYTLLLRHISFSKHYQIKYDRYTICKTLYNGYNKLQCN